MQAVLVPGQDHPESNDLGAAVSRAVEQTAGVDGATAASTVERIGVGNFPDGLRTSL